MQVVRALQGLLAHPRFLAPLFADQTPTAPSSSSGDTKQPTPLASVRDTVGLPFLAARVAAHLEHVVRLGCNCGDIDHCVDPKNTLTPTERTDAISSQFGWFAQHVYNVVHKLSVSTTGALAAVTHRHLPLKLVRTVAAPIARPILIRRLLPRPGERQRKIAGRQRGYLPTGRVSSWTRAVPGICYTA